MLYGTITEFCTEESCPIMSAGPKYEYHWADGLTVKKPIKCSAPKYIDYLMTWVQDQLDDETLFPSKIGKHSCNVTLNLQGRTNTHCSLYVNHFLGSDAIVWFAEGLVLIYQTIWQGGLNTAGTYNWCTSCKLPYRIVF